MDHLGKTRDVGEVHSTSSTTATQATSSPEQNSIKGASDVKSSELVIIPKLTFEATPRAEIGEF